MIFASIVEYKTISVSNRDFFQPCSFFYCFVFKFFNSNAVNDLNNKYKHCLIMCKQISAQEDLLLHDELKGVTLTADKLLYLHAIDLCLNAASLEFFGKAQEV